MICMQHRRGINMLMETVNVCLFRAICAPKRPPTNVESMQRTYHVAQETFRTRATSLSCFAFSALFRFGRFSWLERFFVSFRFVPFVRWLVRFGFLIDTAMLCWCFNGYCFYGKHSLCVFVVWTLFFLWLSCSHEEAANVYGCEALAGRYANVSLSLPRFLEFLDNFNF